MYGDVYFTLCETPLNETLTRGRERKEGKKNGELE